MKQRIRVVAILKDGDKVLVLKRLTGRSEMPVFWELPTGKIKFGEQPEEAMMRTLEEDVGIAAVSIKLKDVITFVALEGSSRLDNLYIVYEVTTNDKPTPRDRYSAYKFTNDFTTIHLGNASHAVLDIEDDKGMVLRQSHRETASAATINVDGASRGNPGPSGIGYVIKDVSGNIVERNGEFIGFTTARSAEYFAMKKGIERAIELRIKSVQFISDNLMLVNQLNGILKPKNADIIPIFNDIQGLLGSFDSVSFTYVPRSENSAADKEANLAIDRILKK
ncbi:reverse transcriptase-like protein [Candidatus Saccharibacteria bacterium]|nr:reverse transcriptase-like protein [Candidatus Saccharibacteria bacterium]